MKKIYPTLLWLITLAAICPAWPGLAQSREPYVSSGAEYIFSFANVNNGGSTNGNVLRFAPVINLQSYLNYDVSSSFGIFTGLELRNVGFIYDVPGSEERKKFRTYNFGIPVGFKVGNLKHLFLYAGYSLEIPFDYKEKTFLNEERTNKIHGLFSDRNSRFAHGFFVGVQLPYGTSVKFKYYLNNFFNKDFTQDVEGETVKPYANFDANVFYLSLSFHLFRNADLYYREYYRPPDNASATR